MNAQVAGAQAGASFTALSGVVGFLNKIEYLFPVYLAVKCLMLVLSVQISAFLIKMLCRVWDTVPFKGGSGT